MLEWSSLSAAVAQRDPTSPHRQLADTERTLLNRNKRREEVEMAAVHILPALTCLLVVATANNTKMSEVYSWKQVNYAFPSDTLRQEAIQSGDFVPENNLPLGLDVWRDKLFVTVPRWRSGVPSTLNYISLKDETKSPLLTPYPDWDSNKLPATATDNSSVIVSTFRVRVDACDRLWVMDTGLADILGAPNQLVQPRILVYSLLNNSLLHRHTLPTSHVKEDSFFANIVVDSAADSCDRAFAYIPDLGSYAVIVYDLAADDSWRIKHHFFHFDPLRGNYRVGGVNFQWTDGVFGLALSAPGDDGYRTLYFHALSSTKEFSVSTRIIQNKTLAAADSYYDFKLLGDKGEDTQATASFLDEATGVLFYTQVNRNGIGCWNTKQPFSGETQALAVSDDETFVFPNDLKVDPRGNLWVLTDRLPHFIYQQLPADQVVYRVFRAPATDVVRGTVCE